MSVIADDGTVGVYDLKTHLSSVLEEVIAGRMVTVTRHGHPIARIQPATASTADERRAAIERMKEARKGRRIGMSMRDAIAEGRR